MQPWLCAVSYQNVSEAITLDKAAEIGLELCKICKPQGTTAQPFLNNKAQGKGDTRQCVGLTKAGTRCQHMTAIANGYCYQHQPE
ncbi:MAG: DUF5763 domain-containing protein [Ginsengibacter sp.]